MQRIKNFFTTVKSLGAYGIILVICVAIIVAATFAFMRVRNDSESIYNETMKLGVLEDTVNYYVINEIIEANYYIYAEDMEEPPEFLNEAREEISIALDDLEMEEYFILSPEEFTFIDIIRAAQEDYERAFEDIRITMSTSDWTWVEILALQADADAYANTMRSALQDWSFKVETIRQEAQSTLASNLQKATRYGVISLILLPFLAIWAFARAGRITQPVLTLTHSAIAIAGGQYRPELLEEFLDRRDRLGELARAMDHLANTTRTRETNLEAEIAGLREQLHETRYRKVRPVYPVHDAESA